MVKKITDLKLIEKAENAFKSIFISTEPMGRTFKDSIEKKLFLYYSDYSMLINFGKDWNYEIDLIKILSNIVNNNNEDKFVLSMTESIDLKNFRDSSHWNIDFDKDQYKELNKFKDYVPFGEQAIYSLSGDLGMMVSSEDFLLIGGKNIFINKISKELLKQGYDTEYQLKRFLSVWKDYYLNQNLSISWIPEMLKNIYGAEQAKRILISNSFMNLSD